MQYNVNNISKDYDFVITGASYIGNPVENTMMYISKKIEKMMNNLLGKKHCLVFAENGIVVADEIKRDNCIVFTDNPQFAYAKCATEIDNLDRKSSKLSLTDAGYYIGNNTQIGANAFIEPGVCIDHDVIIGDNVVIKCGAKIRSNTIIGNNCVIGENAVVGDPAFNIATDGKESLLIPSFGGINIGNNVYIGPGAVISKGSAGNTVIADNVKIDALVRVGHDVVLSEAVELLAACTVAGYCKIGKHSVVATNAALRNRINVGDNCYVGMGSVVQHDVRDNKVLTGNPAVSLEQYGKKKAYEAAVKMFVKSNNLL